MFFASEILSLHDNNSSALAFLIAINTILESLIQEVKSSNTSILCCSMLRSAKKPLDAWYADAKRANWKSPKDIKEVYKNCSIVANNRVVFNIKGNGYRLVAAINYQFSIFYIRFIGTHQQYQKIDVTKI